MVRERFGVDPDTCTGDHSCIRLSGCPSLTVKENPDPLRTDPVAHVDNSCVGCGVCGEVAHAAVLCPSFYRAELIYNPSRWDRLRASTARGGDRRAAAAQRAQSLALRIVGRVLDKAERPIKLTIAALGGQGGGVLADWLIEIAEAEGYIAQSTSVPGCGPAHRRDDLLSGVLPARRRRAGRPRARHGAHARCRATWIACWLPNSPRRAEPFSEDW